MAVKTPLRELVRAGSDLNLQNNEGLTPLMIAARSGRTDITNVLLEGILEGEHIDLDIQEKGTGQSALHFSVERGDSATTEALLKAGRTGWSALHLLTLTSKTRMVTLPWL
jgi:ankyrin repeat protein